MPVALSGLCYELVYKASGQHNRFQYSYTRSTVKKTPFLNPPPKIKCVGHVTARSVAQQNTVCASPSLLASAFCFPPLISSKQLTLLARGTTNCGDQDDAQWNVAGLPWMDHTHTQATWIYSSTSPRQKVVSSSVNSWHRRCSHRRAPSQIVFFEVARSLDYQSVFFLLWFRGKQICTFV